MALVALVVSLFFVCQFTLNSSPSATKQQSVSVEIAGLGVDVFKGKAEMRQDPSTVNDDIAALETRPTTLVEFAETPAIKPSELVSILGSSILRTAPKTSPPSRC